MSPAKTNSSTKYKGPERLSPSAAAAVAKGLITPDSRILTHFKTNIQAPQLTARLMKRRDFVELRDMLRVYLAGFKGLDPTHMSAALNRLQILLKQEQREASAATTADVAPQAGVAPDAAPQAAGGDGKGDSVAMALEIMELLCPTMAGALAKAKEGKGRFQRQFRMDTACSVLWALAKLPRPVRAPVPSEMLDALLARATRDHVELHGASPHIASLLLWSISKLQQQAAPAGDAALTLSPDCVTAAVDAVLAATLSPARAVAYLQQSSPAVLAQLAVSLGELGRLSDEHAGLIAAEVSRRLPSLAFAPFKPADLVGVATGLAGANARGTGQPHPHASLYALIAAHVAAPDHAQELLRPKGAWRPPHISHLASAFASARVRHDGLLSALSSAAQARSGEFHGWALTELHDACAALGHGDAAAWMPAAAAAAAKP
ncbi:hypothetical protein FOA52_001435 [Chlamydomonas sp. UWO 241]|nr:hypothetical protein FOA52_001435 [Chlamydomonas sp. UWO 241]